ncbi:hypothetical protein E2320_006833 [Naja naja]|nr:hypothetical protein E2320_006833 [Naja naja]
MEVLRGDGSHQEVASLRLDHPPARGAGGVPRGREPQPRRTPGVRHQSGDQTQAIVNYDHSQAKKEEKHELKEMMEHEQMQEWRISGPTSSTTPPPGSGGTPGKQLKKTPLYVDFKEIGWDSWIIAPLATMPTSAREPAASLDGSQSTTHARVQTSVHLNDPQRASPACYAPTS